MPPKFGPAGNPNSFYAEGHKHTQEIPLWLFNLGLDAYEYQCGNGVNVGEATALKIGKEAKENKISLSLHAPYYISMSSLEEDKRLGSIKYILQSAVAAKAMGATRIIIHTGSCGKQSRERALELAKDTFKLAISAMDSEGFSDIALCPETMGKMNQLGTLEEVLELCKLDERLIPTIDFGHLNARTMGSLQTYKDFENIFDLVENALGFERLKIFHSHFSKIEFTVGGEKKHLTFEDEVFGPNFDFVAELTYKKGLSPTFICESDGTMAEDALRMKKMYNSFSI